MKQALLLALLSLTLWADAHLFVHHRFGDSAHASTNTSLEVLRKQFEYFKNNNYEVITLEKLNDALKAKQDIPDNWVVFCIDDSYKSADDVKKPYLKDAVTSLGKGEEVCRGHHRHRAHPGMTPRRLPDLV